MPKKTVAGTVAEEVAENTAEVETEAVKNEPKYVVNKLREKSIQLFGVSQSAFDGAMHGHNEVEYTINEVKAILSRWLYGKGGKK